MVYKGFFKKWPELQSDSIILYIHVFRVSQFFSHKNCSTFMCPFDIATLSNRVTHTHPSVDLFAKPFLTQTIKETAK